MPAPPRHLAPAPAPAPACSPNPPGRCAPSVAGQTRGTCGPRPAHGLGAICGGGGRARAWQARRSSVPLSAWHPQPPRQRGPALTALPPLPTCKKMQQAMNSARHSELVRSGSKERNSASKAGGSSLAGGQEGRRLDGGSTASSAAKGAACVRARQGRQQQGEPVGEPQGAAWAPGARLLRPASQAPTCSRLPPPPAPPLPCPACRGRRCRSQSA